MYWITALETLEATPKGKARTEKLSELMDSCDELATVLKYAMDPLITFGVQQLPDNGIATAVPSQRTIGLQEFSLHREMLLDKLASRELTGNAAQMEIANWFVVNDPEARKWLGKIITQSLNLGIGPKTVNKVRPGTIFEFPVPLAEKIQKAKESHLKGRWIAQAKADGGRVIAILPAFGGKVVLHSRTGHIWENFESIREELQRLNKERNGDTTHYLDGEVVSYVGGRIDFQAIQSTMFATERATEVGELKYLVFDGATEDEWNACEATYDSRYKDTVEFMSNHINTPNIKMLPIVGIFHDPSADLLWDLQAQLVEEGWEGLMIRKADAPVQLKRSWDLIKVKFFEDMEVTVIGVESGRNGTRLYETCGTLVCQDKDGVTFRAGSGLSDNLRDEIWADPGAYIGRLLVVKFFGRTDDNIPRHPIVHYFRHVEDT